MMIIIIMVITITIIMGETSTHATQDFCGKVCHSILKKDLSFSYINAFIRKYFVFPTISF